MKASVVIITKNQKHLLQRSLPVLLAQDLKEGYEIIVVDSGSKDGAREYVESLPVKLIKIPPETFRFSSAFNTGAKEAKGEFLVRLSGDVIPKRKDFLSEILSPFKDPKVGTTYGKYTVSGVKDYTYPDFWSTNRFPNKLTRYSHVPNPVKLMFSAKHRKLVFNLAGGCCALRREIWRRRPFNERLPAAEDAEYSFYLHSRGYDVVFNPKAVVLHEHKVAELKDKLSWKRRLFELKWRIGLCREIVLTYLKLFLLNYK